MKTVLDYIQILESEGASNVVSSGAIATTTPPIGALKKRKPPATVESAGSDPLATVYAPEHPETTEVDSDDAEKRMFHFRQQSQNDQVSNL